jgi:hypothetical protein
MALLLKVNLIAMNKPVVSPAPVAKSLAEQKSDFTAEGSPPPGKVATSTPVDSSEPEKASPARRRVRATTLLRRVAARSNP